ncbi:MAG: hypothetical protein JO141_15955 [Bradyrhizobium sp.]|nr:hypothetical protein [Bradyrhizobium sp.]
MKRWMAQLDIACAWVNPGLVIAAIILAMLDVAAAGQRWTLAHPQASAKTAVTAKSENCAPAPPPELRDMAGRD